MYTNVSFFPENIKVTMQSHCQPSTEKGRDAGQGVKERTSGPSTLIISKLSVSNYIDTIPLVIRVVPIGSF